MTNMNPFELRLELIKLAKDILEQEYYAKREALQRNWEVQLEKSSHASEQIPALQYPPYPTDLEIIEKAKHLNNFVSSK